MRILVTAASKYGATREIAEAIGDALTEQGHTTTVAPIDEVSDVSGYDAIVIGSAVYAGHWLAPAKELVTTHAEVLRDRAVWLFSSGPVGHPPKPEADPVDVERMLELSGARAHQVFSGRIDLDELRFADKAIVLAMRAPRGDFRDWDEIRTWAEGISATLAAGAR